MKICVVGGGHIGTTLSCYIKHTFPNYEVVLYTRKPEQFADKLKCNDIEQNISYVVSLDEISKDPTVVKEAQVIYIALPHFAVEKAFRDIAPYVEKNTYIGVLPGGGGCEFYFKKYFTGEQILFGFQRVPFTAKLVQYGVETNLKSWKPFSVVGTLQQGYIDEACNLIEKCGLNTRKATNYLEIALTPTNPILHTSRMYELFGPYASDYVFPEKKKFYVGWADVASNTLMKMDDELHQLLKRITQIKTDAIRPLTEHYESETIEDLTQKINSIQTFQSVFAPMRQVDDGYIADLSSRMFTEDFPWGLAVIRSYFTLFDMSPVTIDQVLHWYSEYMGYEWYVEGKFCGKDLLNTGIIQNYGIKSVDDLIEIYQS